jgi:hypothetical protein
MLMPKGFLRECRGDGGIDSATYPNSPNIGAGQLFSQSQISGLVVLDSFQPHRGGGDPGMSAIPANLEGGCSRSRLPVVQ